MSGDVIDRAAIDKLLDMIGGDPEDLQELIDEFNEETPAIVATMDSAAQAGDMDALRIAVHGLKSNGRDMGALALADLCADLEHACKDGTVTDPVGQVSAIKAELTRATTALSGLSLTND